MSKNNVEKLLLAGGSDKTIRLKYNQIETKEKFVLAAAADGYELYQNWTRFSGMRT